MAKYIMLGKYSVEGIKGISKERTGKVKKIIEKEKGKVEAMYALLGNYDLCFIVEFPGNNEVMKASVEIAKSTGIAFTTLPAMSVEEFDKILG